MLEAAIMARPRTLLIRSEVQAGLGLMSMRSRLWQDSPRREIERSRTGCGSRALRGWR